MKFTAAFVVSVLCIIFIVKQLNGARILAVKPIPSYSHQIPFRPLWKELHKRGHEIVLIAPNEMPDMNSTNFKQISIGSAYKDMNTINFVMCRFHNLSWIQIMRRYLQFFGTNFVEHVLNNPEVKKLYAPDSKEKFDVVMIELFHLPAMYMLAHRFNAPLIGLSSFGIPVVEEYMLGGLILPSHPSTWEMEGNVGTNLSFWKRLQNFWILWYYIYVTYRDYMPIQQQLAEKYFGKSSPTVFDIAKNMSLVFVNQDPIMSYARPSLPNLIMFSSSHISENLEPLPQDLKEFVDSATNGFIYLSFGTNARFASVPEDVQQIFYDTFAMLPYKVVMKFENTPKTHKNIYKAKWLPQKSILAHRNVKLYIFQGGLHSTQEAIHYNVPVLGFPIMSDQTYQLKIIESHGIGKSMNILNFSKEMLASAIEEIINDGRYKENMVKLQIRINDTPHDFMQNLVWWTEYVIRNRGAPQFYNTLAWESWYQYGDMDVVVFLSIVTFIVALIVLIIIVKLFLYICKRCLKSSTADSKIKKN